MAGPSLSERLSYGRLGASASEIVDAGVELLPHFEMAAIPLLDGMERPGEEPRVGRRLRAKGVRVAEHRGVLLLEPGELDKMSSSGFLSGGDEIFFLREFNEEFETFPGRITPDVQDFNEASPLGLEEWMVDSGCLLAVGDGRGVNYATLSSELSERLRSQFQAPKR